MSVKLLTEYHLEFLSLRGGCTGSSESTFVKMSNCWKSHSGAHISVLTNHNMAKSFTDRPRIPSSLFISNVQARSTLLQFIQGSDGINPVTHWIVEALEGENATDYKEIHNVS